MSKIEKIIEKMRNNPLDWRVEDIEKVASHYGFAKRTTSGSHATFSHKKLIHIITIPARRPIKPVYVKNFLKLIDELEK